MLRLLRGALGGVLSLLVLLAACNRTDASAAVKDSGENDVAADGSETSEAPDLSQRPFPLLAWAVFTLEQEYFDRNRFEPQVQFEAALEELGLHTPEFFAAQIEGGGAMRVRVRASSTQFRTDDLETLEQAARRLEEVLIYAQTILDLEPEPLHELEYAAINGLLSPLDPHTTLLTPEQHADLGVRTRGMFGGIGAEIRAERRRIVVVRVTPKMPAELAGLEAGDVFIRIAGQATVNMTPAEAQGLLRGPVGTPVKVKVRRKERSLDIEIERAIIRVDSVVATPLPGGVEHLRISNFQEDTGAQLRVALEAATARGDLKAVVLDLRGNAGGLLAQSTEIVDAFVPKGELVIVRSAFGREVSEAKTPMAVPADLPIAILVDEESASAAEIVSGGLQALGRATVLGRSSFGKGSVQVVRPAVPYGRELALKLTIAEYLVAGDQRIQARGVVPDVELLPVEPTAFAGVVRYYSRERFERARERSRMAGHPSAKHELAATEAAEPAGRLRYFATPEVPAALLADLPEGDEPPRALRDPEVRIARAWLLEGLAAPTAEAAARISRFTTRAQAEEDTRIQAALKDGGVVWGPEGANTGELELRARVPADAPIVAGAPFVLEVSLTNRSSTTLHRVHAVTDCVHDEIDGIEMMIGDIEPGATRVRELQLRVMPWHADFVGDLNVDVHIGEPDAEPDAAARAVFETASAPRPQISFDVWIVDDPALAKRAPSRPAAEPYPGAPAFEVSGNGDGMLQPGERVLLAFTAHNNGAGKGPDVRGYLRNLSGAQGLLEEGLVPLGALEPGESASGAFGLSVNPKADPDTPFLLELTVGDGTLRTSAQGKLELRVMGAAAELQREAAASFVVEGDEVRLRAGAHPSSPVVAVAPEGAALASLGTIAGWHVVAAKSEPSRRWFIPGDLDSLKAAPSDAKTSFDLLEVRTSVRPPAISLSSTPRVTTASAVTVSGVVNHPHEVRDVVLMVRKPGPGQDDDKVDYFAADAKATELPFSAEVPLQPGGNRIILLARDSAGVTERKDVWVYRGKAG